MEENKEFISIERPKYGEFVFIRGKNSLWEIDDVLWNEICGEIGKVVNVELDESLDEWVYTFDDGHKSDESVLVEKCTIKL